MAKSHETGAINVRKLAAMVVDHESNFQAIHGLLDLIMIKVGAKMGSDYSLEQDLDDTRWFNGGVSIKLNGKTIGAMGVLHPEILGNFELKYPVTALEIDFEGLFEHFKVS